MKIVCMIGPPSYLNYFVNVIADEFELELVIQEKTPIQNLGNKIREKGLINSFKILYHKLSNRNRFINDFNKILTNKWQSITEGLPVLQVSSINNPSVIAELDRIKPDLVLVHGTTLIKKDVLKDIPLALNLHWGLSPYYRGSYCTEWALINSDPQNIGYTIHKISSKIDGGDILTQGCISIDDRDSANSINMKLTKAGTTEMISVISKLINGEKPHFETQSSVEGFLYLTRHWNWSFQRIVRRIEKQNGIKKMLSKPTRPFLPIKKWK